jgi:probable HAF family extracellular repeat protein
MKKSRSFPVLLSAICILSALATAQSYSVTDLGSLDPGGVVDVSYGEGINSSGYVVGSSYSSVNTLHAFLWTGKSGIHDLGTLGGTNSIAWGINDSQQVVGQADPPSGLTHAFLWTQAQGMQDLGTLGGSESFAYAINYFGQVAGQAYLATGFPHAFLWTREGGMQDLGTLGGSTSVAYAINKLGQVTGASDVTGDTDIHSFLWTKERGMQDLGTIQSYNPSYGFGINDFGQVVGYAGLTQLYQYTYGFQWSSSRGLQQLPFSAGSIQNFPMAVNDLNQITGQFNDSFGDPHAFILAKTGGIQDLNKFIPANSGWILNIGSAINLKGQVTGWGPVLINGAYTNHAFLLTRNR